MPLPLGPYSSDEEGPCLLPDGQIVCGPHGLVVCDECCTDYADPDPTQPDEDQEDCEYCRGPEKIRGTGRVFPTTFTPPTTSILPTELFPGRRTYGKVTRYVHRDDPRAVLIMTDGACLDNGQANPKAGWALVHGPGLTNKPAIISARLEKEGPFGDEAVQTSNRAELRAVIEALRFRYWPAEGFRTITIATDSEYVVKGSTKWAKTWVKNNWKTSANACVKNKDLWELLLGDFERSDDEGLRIRFWWIPRNWNKNADAAAKKAAAEDTAADHFMGWGGHHFPEN